MKQVRFSSDSPQRYTYDNESNKDGPTFHETYRESLQRKHLETQLLSNPHSEMARLQDLFESSRHFDVTLVFGNLGRHPHLLNYFLDFCFTASDTIGVIYKSFQPEECPYQVSETSNLNFLFIVEPEFGYTVSKPAGVDHVIVLSSHLYLWSPRYREQVRLLHLGTTILRESMLKVEKTWKPPMFCNKEIMNNSRVKLDVTFCKSAHEAYLRLLTGRQILRYRQIPAIVSPQTLQVLQSCIARSRTIVRRHFSEKWLEEWYFDILQTCEPNPFDFILKRNPLSLSESNFTFEQR